MAETVIGDVYLSRQLILNRKQEIVGYELSLIPAARDDEVLEHRKIRSEILIYSVYSELSIQNALGQTVAFLNVDPDFLYDEILEALPAKSIVLELKLITPPNRELVERCIALRKQRYSIALINYNGLDEISTSMLSVLDLVKVSIKDRNKNDLTEIIGPIAKLPITVVADGIKSKDDLELCVSLGFDLFQGNYFSHPEIVEGRKLTASQINIINIINLANKETHTNEVEDRIKREPQLTINLLNIVNTADRGLTKKVSSIRDAILLLGRRRLQRWLHLSLMSPNGGIDIKTMPILQVAILRGRMLELIITKVNRNYQPAIDKGFIAGLMSVMPLALGMSMADIVNHITLEQDIQEALLVRTGWLGELLELIEAFDNEEISKCNDLLIKQANNGITRDMLNKCLVDALRWVNEPN